MVSCGAVTLVCVATVVVLVTLLGPMSVTSTPAEAGSSEAESDRLVREVSKQVPDEKDGTGPITVRSKIKGRRACRTLCFRLKLELELFDSIG